MNYQQAIELATTKLSSISESANLDAQLLLSYTCKIEQTKLLAHPKQKLNERQLKSFHAVLERRAQGEPLAYITGTKEFWSLDFIVSHDTLVPRPETELLVELALGAIEEIKSPCILDLGTGSGAIAIAIANERKDCNVVATDISQSALDVAKKNAKWHQANINLICSDWFEKLTDKKFDVIISNPPYIAHGDPNLDKFASKYEPSSALISKKSGLFDLKEIINNAKDYLANNGCLVVEHGFKQAQKVQKIFAKQHFTKIVTHKDLSGLDRVTLGYQ